ncbi:MAG: hypothetical protein O2888_05435 [Chloroflexi bacterium]|nr:hypothetical protein [Chloroflexota bacterium]
MSITPDPSTLARIADLQRLSIEELDHRFEAGGVPSFAEIAGPTMGAWLHRETQPWWAAVFVRLALDNPGARWTGKGFVLPFNETESGAGVNLFANRILPLRFQFETRIRNADHDGKPCLALIYPRGSVMRGLIDDVRLVADGVLLGRMEYRFPGRRAAHFAGYFVLAR